MLELPSTRIVWTRADIFHDGPDTGENPDVRPRLLGEYTLRPSIREAITYTDPSGLVTVNIRDVKVRHNLNGELVTMDGRPINVMASDAEGLNYTGWVWTIMEIPGLAFPSPAGETVDISDYVETPATPDVKHWVGQLPELRLVRDEAVDAATRAEAAANLTRETNIEIGTVTTGQPGSNASAIIVGEAPDFALNMTIPRGDSGGWVNVTSLSGTPVNLDTLFTPGTYRTNTAQMGPGSGAPTMVGGVIEVVGGLGQVTTQKFTPIGPFGSGLTPLGVYFTRINQWNNISSWNPWILHSGEPTLYPRQIWANGRPDIPATTPYTLSQLNSVPIGHEYVSLDRPQGARRWIKMGATTWRCVEGDTGWVDLRPFLVDGWTATRIDARRINGDIRYRFGTVRDGTTTSILGGLPQWTWPPPGGAVVHMPTQYATASTTSQLALGSTGSATAPSTAPLMHNGSHEVVAFASDRTWPTTLTS